jgi:hypothetical protein
MLGYLPSVAVLGLALLVALRLTVDRLSPTTRQRERASAASALAIALAAQAVHFGEEAVNGFPERLGSVLDLPAMSVGFFVCFNLVWLGIWCASVFGIQDRRAWAFVAAWFLSIAGMMNGVLHPVLATVAGGYFPGLWSSTVVGAASAWLFLKLRAATESTPTST